MAPTPPVEPAQWRPPSWRTRLYALGAAAILFGVLGLTGGLDQVDQPAPSGPPTAPVNEYVDAGPWKSMVTNAAATPDLGVLKPRTAGNWLLAVAVQIELTDYYADSLGSAMLDDAVTLRGVEGLVKPEPQYVALIRDGSTFEYLQPGLPERIAFVFEMAKSAPVPAKATVVLHGRDVYWSFAERTYMWDLDIVVKAEVTVDVANRMTA